MVASEKNLEDSKKSENWVLFLTGHASLDSFKYKIYIGTIFSVQFYLMGSAIATLFFISATKEIFVKTFHVVIVLIYSFGVLICRISVDKSLKKTRQLLKTGIYEYSNEPPDDNLLEMKKNGERMVKRRTTIMVLLMVFSAVSNSVLFPLTQLLFVSEDHPDTTLNPYLAHPFYMPFSTWTIHGFTGGFLINCLYLVVVYGFVIASNDIYTSCTGILKTQLEILNYSLRNIKGRAFRTYGKAEITHLLDLTDEQLLQTEDFHKRLFDCLKSDVKHHHAIIRFKNTCHPYIGTVLLDVVTVAAFVVGSVMSLLLQQPPLNSAINYILTLLAEVGYPLYLCYCGEDVLQESTKVYESLYATPWFHCDERFKRTLRIMMINTKTPLKVKTTAFELTASLETFGGVMSGMYKFVNLLRHK